MGDESEWKKLPTEEKCEHKNWKARLEGYEEAAKLFRMATDPKSPQYMTYLGLVKKFVIDTNQVAQDKGLEAVLAFVENIPYAAKTVGEVMPGIVAKCLNSRPKIKEKAYEVILMYIEAEKQEIVQEELIKGLENKQPKIVFASIEIMRTAINLFGSKVMPIKPVIKFVPKLLENRDKTVRDEAKLLAVEMYRWAGNAIMPQLQTVTPLVMAELEEDFNNIKEGNVEKARQTRFLRSQQELKSKMEAELEQQESAANENQGGGNGAQGEDPDEDIDPYDLLDPVDILSKLPKDFKEKLEAKKWQERKEVLDVLLNLVEKHQRLQSGDYYEVVHDLQKIVAKDSNVNIVVVAAKCISGIAKGIRKEFSKYAQMCLTPLLERTKEKKPHIVEALRTACDSIFPSTNLENIAELVTACLVHKTPIVRTQTALFLVKCFCQATTTTLPKKVLKLYLPNLIKNLGEADPTVRESCSEALGALLKALGEKIILPLLSDIEQIKQDKIKEYAEKCVLLNAKGEPRAGAQAASAPAPVVSKAAPTKASVVAKPTKPTTASTVKKPGSAAAKPGAKEVKKVVKGSGGAVDEAKKGPVIPEESDLHSELVEEKAQELLGAECYSNLSVANWKERMASMETMMNKIKSLPSDDVPVQVLIRTLAKKPGFKDSHFQVLKQRIEIVSMLADQGYKFTKQSASYCLNEIAEKIGDIKAGEQAKNALGKIAEQVTLALVVTTIVPSVFTAKNPKNHENLLTWLCTAIREFGFQGIEMKFMLKYIKDALASTNPAVRNAAYQLIATIYLYAGPSFGALFEQEKPAILELINAEIDKVKGEKAPVPTRGANVPKASKGGSASAGGDEDADEDDDDPLEQQRKQEALIPRTDINDQLNDALLDQMNDKNWKERQAALEKIDQILRENKYIEANLSEFPTHLGKRLTDTNKILATTSLKISEKLALALGSQGRRYVSVLAPGMIQALSDNKVALRNTAISALNCWFDNCGGLTPFLEGDLLADALSSANSPNIKAEMCGWLAQVLPKCKKGKLPPELKAIVPTVFGYIEDRNPEVRTKSQELLVPLMMHVGPNDMLRALQKLKPTSQPVVQPLLEKARAEVAARQPAPVPKAAPQKTASTAAPLAKKPAKTIYDDSPDESSEPPEPAPVAKKVIGAKGKDEKNKKEAEPKPAPTSSKKKGGEEEDLSPVMQVSDKQKRMNEERALKTLKWNFDVPRKEFIEQLRNQIENAGFNKTLIGLLFHEDFKKQILALEMMSRAIVDLKDAAVSNLDLMLRWLSLRFFETNPTVMLKAIEFQLSLFNMLIEKKVHLTDFEANGFIPYFIGKLGDRQDSIRKGFRQIAKLISQCYSPVKLFNFLIQGLASKNSRQRTECLEELGQMIEAIGLNSLNPSVTIKEIAKQISDRDNGVRSAALNVVTIAYQICGDQVYKYTGKLNDKEMSYLEERIKRSAKQAPNAGVRASASAQMNKEHSRDQAHPAIPNSNSLSSITSSKNGQQCLPEAPAFNGHNSSNGQQFHGNKPLEQEQQLQQQMQSAQNVRLPSRNITPKKFQTITKHKGEFCLDLKDDDDDKNNDIQIKLTPHSDLDELLNQPVEMPPPRKNVNSYPISILKESQDCHEAIDLVITHISHQKLDISFQNLVQIDVVIKDKEKKDLLVQHIDNLLNTCALKLNVAHNVYLNSDYQVEEVFRLFKGLFSVILDVFENDLGKHASAKTLKDVIYNLLCVMIDSKILNFNEGDQLIKAINIVTLRLLELSNQTTSYCALVKLLNESCHQESSYSSSKYLELVMKCIWRQIRRLSSNNTGSESLIQQIDTAKVLQEIHTFLSLYPSSSWQNKQSDLPLRTVKTLLFHLAKAKQSKIIEDLESLNVPDDSEIKIYIVKLFKNGFQLTNSNNTNGNSNSASTNNFGFSRNASGSNLKNADATSEADKVSQQLRTIVRKISTEQTKESLRELYNFKQQHPDVDLDKYFEKSSGKLKTYIQENLKLIELEANSNKSSRPVTSPMKSSNLSSKIGSNTFLTNDLSKASHTSGSRNVDDIMKTIADWKSKTHLNILDNEDNDENNIRSGVSSYGSANSYGLNNDYSRLTSGIGNGSSSRLYNGSSPGHRTTTLNTLENRSEVNTINAEKYQNIAKDLKKKYTRSRTESDQLNDLKALDMKAKNFNENSTSSSNLNSLNLQQNESTPATAAPSTEYSQMSSENLYDEYKRRLELIKKLKPVS